MDPGTFLDESRSIRLGRCVGATHERLDLSDRPDRCDHVHSFVPWSALTARSKRVCHDLH